MYLIMVSVKQIRIKYHFLSLWYESILDWTPVSRAIGEHSTYKEKWTEMEKRKRTNDIYLL